MCGVSRHYPYQLHEVLRLTPKQAFHMLAAYSRERMDVFDAVATMLGAKKTDSSFDVDNIDTTAIDKISAGHMDRLNREANVG